MIAARVEDFPDPVGPVTSTMPLRSVAISASVGGSFSSWSDGIFVGMTRSTAAKVPRCRKTLTRNRARPGRANEKSHAPCSFSVRSACSLPPMRSRAIRAVSSACSIGSAGTSTPVSSPCFSTCGGRAGEKMRSLMPGVDSSMAAISAGVSIGGATALGAPKSALASACGEGEVCVAIVSMSRSPGVSVEFPDRVTRRPRR